MLKKLKKNLKKIWDLIPIKIRFVSVSVFLFMLWWGLGTDTFFSLYIKEIIWNARWVTVIGTILAVSKLALVIPIWRLNDHEDVKNILLIWKFLYAIVGILFFLAWICHSWPILLVATILNWFANATTFTTYRSCYWKKATKSDTAKVFWAYFSAQFIAEVIGSLIAAILVRHLELPYMYLFVVIFALVSLVQDQKIRLVISKHYHRTWNKLSKQTKKFELKLNEDVDNISQNFLWKWWFVSRFLKECVSTDSWKDIWVILHKYPKNTYIALFSMTLTNFLNYIGFLFIPIISAQNNLSLSQIAVVFAAMKAPYIVNVFLWKFGDKYSKKLLISWILIVMSFLYIAMWFASSFGAIITLTFFISFWIAMLNPLTSALVSSYTLPEDKGAMSGAQDFASRIWDISWVLWFGILSSLLGLSRGFMIVWLSTLWLAGYLFTKKLISRHRKNNEREKKKTQEVYELPVPIVDVVHK